eukprot:Gregarina_sp_Pseudo_9__283@NODE_1181_length_1808_cov_20_745619_g1107_i0_p1_GENE_NODE_1181_length_1808_cov_20_745619_g1107_i0NODE_1181_length_1808_cov_20_745619_g1107_i0_p1_ORF_typecomplete_len392_score53_32BTB_2/PF02214_22/2_7e12_NODE_1181_length_1808_cov_20_745619_g1107_i04841659
MTSVPNILQDDSQVINRTVQTPGTPLNDIFKLAAECERPTSSMQCSQGTLSTCPTARTSPYNPHELSFRNAEGGLLSGASLFKRFPGLSASLKCEPAAECINDLPDSVKIVFNVGGKEYWCTVATLRGGAGALFPEDEDCFFKKLLKKPWAATLVYQSGGAVCCYIDRNGKCFPYILDYVRRGGITSTDDRGLLDMIAFEADFYGLHRLKMLAEARLADLQSREDKVIAIGQSLGDVVNRLVAMEQRVLMPSLNSLHRKPDTAPWPASPHRHAFPTPPLWHSTESFSSSGGHTTGAAAGTECGLRRDLNPALRGASSSAEMTLYSSRSGPMSPCSIDRVAASPHGSALSSFEQSRVLLINDDPEEPCDGASIDVLCKFYAEDRKFATDEDF